MPKQISFGAKPKVEPSLENWVENRDVPTPEPNTTPVKVEPAPVEETQLKMKRLTLDIPEELHRKIKGQAAIAGVTMVDMLRALLEEHYS